MARVPQDEPADTIRVTHPERGKPVALRIRAHPTHLGWTFAIRYENGQFGEWLIASNYFKVIDAYRNTGLEVEFEYNKEFPDFPNG